MKTTTKVWLIVAAALVVIGGFGFVGAMAANHWQFGGLGTTKYVTTEVEVTGTFSDISVIGDTEDITFVKSEDGKCRVVFVERETDKHEAVVQGGTLTIKTEKDASWRESFSVLSLETPSITVYLPGNAYGELTIRVDTGSSVIPADFTFKGIDIKASTGDVDCAATCSGRVQVQTSTGAILVHDVTVGGLGMSVTTGKVEVRNVVCAESISLKVTTGKTLFEGVTCAGIITDGNTGAVTLRNVICSEKISIERSTGDVKLEGCDAAELYIKTSTGDVTGTLKTPKVFIVRSDTGKIDVPETTTGGTCKITTSTGSIRISVG